MGIYRPPITNYRKTNSLLKFLEEKISENTIILGDFNLNSKDIEWNNKIPKPITKIGTLFTNFLNNHSLISVTPGPTRKDSTLDLILTTNPELLSYIKIDGSIFNSDHEGIYFNIKIPTQNILPPKISFRNYNSINTNQINTFLSHTLNHELTKVFTIDQKYHKFTHLITEALDLFAPNITYYKKHKPLNYPTALKGSIKQKEVLWRKMKKNPSQYTHQYNQISIHIKIQIRRFYENQEKKFLQNNPQNIYKYLGNDFESWNIPILHHENQILADDLSKAENFATYFSMNFANNFDTTKTLKNLPNSPNPENTIENVNFNVLDFLEIIMYKKDKNNISPDFISFRTLKKFHLTLAKPITDLFQLSLNSGKLPNIWKKSIILPFYKKGDRNLLTNYRPISLTCSSCRILEKIIANQLYKFLTNNSLISPNQFGFMAKRSTTSQLISLMEDWHKALASKKNIDCIYLDIRKAFDTVPHKLLLYKIHQIGIRGKLYEWIKDFLTERSFTVKIKDQYSRLHPILSGVPQGSVLGPILFLIYINDLPKGLPHDIVVKLFADDTKLYHIHQNKTANHLQLALNQISDWAKKWGLQFSLDKTHVMYLGHSNKITDYYLNGQKINQTNSIKDLGVIFDNELKFDLHISDILKKAYFRAKKLFKKIKSRIIRIWSLIYKSYVRPVLDYAAVIWTPHLKKDIERIEKFQRFFTRIALKKCCLPPIPYEKRLELFKLPTLENRRKITDIITTFKIINNYTHLKPNEYFTFSKLSRHASSRIIAKIQNHRSTNSFVNRSTKYWNKLGKEVTSAPSIQTFKTRLAKVPLETLQN